MNLRFMPGLLLVLIAVFVYGLTYHAENRQRPEPSYDFYLPSVVRVQLEGAKEALSLHGQYLNILEGKREYVDSTRLEGPERWRMDFSVNSPRPALLYINDRPIEIFLVPGDSNLELYLELDTLSRPTHVRFYGENAEICTYLQKKYERFQQVQIRSNRKLIAEDDFAVYASKLDSMAARELAFLAEQEVFTTLPGWFVDFEKNDILYQKAFLKLSQAYNRNVDSTLLDAVPIISETAMFSHYYYLYLNVYLRGIGNLTPVSPQPDQPDYDAWHLQYLAVAADKLDGGPRDVFFTREIFGMLQDGKLGLAEESLAQYKSHFSSRKYFRFLSLQLELKQKNRSS